MPRPGLDDLYRNRGEIDLISTDVFDTLLLRRGKSQRAYLCRGSPVWPLPERTGTVHRVGFAAMVMVLWVVILRDELAGRALNHVLELAFVAGTGAAAYVATLLALGMRLIAGQGRFELADRR